MANLLHRITLIVSLVSTGIGSMKGQPMDIKFDRFDQWPGYIQQAVRFIGEDAPGFLWLTTPSGSMRFDGNSFEFFSTKPFAAEISNNPITEQLTDMQGRMWSGEGMALGLRQAGAPALNFKLPAGAGEVRAVFLHPAVSGDSIIWLLADSALLCFHIDQGRFIRDYRNRSHDVQSLYGQPFHTAFISREGILWLGGEGGLCKYDWRNQEFRLYNLNPESATKGGEINFVQGVLGDSSRCWITTDEFGLLQFDLVGHRLLPEKIFGELERLSQRNTYSMSYDNLGRLWVGNVSDSIFVCDVDRGKIVRRIPLNGDLIHFIATDVSLGHFWRLCKPTSNRPAIIRIHNITMESDTFWVPYWQNRRHQNRIDFFAPVINDQLWFIHDTEYIEYFNPSLNLLTQKAIKLFSGITPDMSIVCNLRYDAARKVLWLMSDDSVYKLNWEQQTAETFSNPLMKPGQMNRRIHTDDLGRLWIQNMPDNVLYKFDPIRKTFARYDWSDGLPNTAVECVDMDRVGKKWCQRYPNYTFLLFDPLKIPVLSAAPPIITGIRVGSRKHPKVIGPATSNVGQIRTAHNTIQIEFTSIAFEQGRHLQFRYQLSNVDTGWVNPGDERMARYSDLPAGSYSFQVMVANREGDWYPAPAVVLIQIWPPIHGQKWFRITCSILFLGLLYMTFRIWEKRRIVHYQLRQRIAEDLHHEVEWALGGISSLSASSQSDGREGELLERIEQHTLTASEKLSDLVWFLNPENDSTEQFVRHIRHYIQAQPKYSGITPVLWVDKSVKRLSIPIEKRKAFYQNFKDTLSALVSRHPFDQMEFRISAEKGQLKMEIHWEQKQQPDNKELASSQNHSIIILSDP